jgi:replication factor C subunit 3/5
LNASDERGIDIIRNQISNFVNSKPLFNNGMKFVILDEVDYMTKNAQQALRYLLQNYTGSVRFCLICNYISKIDEGLQNEFIRLRFNQLPKEDIIIFLKHISDSENLNMTEKSIQSIQKLYKSDIRSMINFIQSNQDILKIDENYNVNCKNNISFNIIDNDVWLELINKLKNREKIEQIISYINQISINYNIDKKNIIKDFLNYIIRKHNTIIDTKFLDFVENLMHSQDTNNNIYIYYSLTRLSSLLSNKL